MTTSSLQLPSLTGTLSIKSILQSAPKDVIFILKIQKKFGEVAQLPPQKIFEFLIQKWRVLVHSGEWILYLVCLQEKAAEGLMSSLQVQNLKKTSYIKTHRRLDPLLINACLSHVGCG